MFKSHVLIYIYIILIYYTLTVCCTPRKRYGHHGPTPGIRRIISSFEGADRAFYSCTMSSDARPWGKVSGMMALMCL